MIIKLLLHEVFYFVIWRYITLIPLLPATIAWNLNSQNFELNDEKVE